MDREEYLKMMEELRTEAQRKWNKANQEVSLARKELARATQERNKSGTQLHYVGWAEKHVDDIMKLWGQED